MICVPLMGDCSSEPPHYIASMLTPPVPSSPRPCPFCDRFMVKAVQSPYGSSGDYMWHLAKVHCVTRDWKF